MLAIAVPRFGRAAEPIRLSAAGDGASWSVLERTSSGWRPLFSHAHVHAETADGADAPFSHAAVSSDGRSISFQSPDMAVKILARWLPDGRLPATVTLLPVAFARHAGVRLKMLQIAQGATVAPLGDSPRVLVNGYQAWSRTEVAPLETDKPLQSWWVSAIHASHRSFLAGYASNVVGLNLFTLETTADGITLSDRSEYGRLPISSTADGTTLDALYVAAGPNPSDLLAQYAAAARVLTNALDPAPQQTAKGVPTGWCSWYGYQTGIAEGQVLANADAAVREFGTKDLRVVQVDDGFQMAAGDWDTNARFPHGHKWLTGQLHAKGFQAGLWLAPFAVSESSTVFKQHPDWILKRTDGAPAKMWDNASWGGAIYSLDATLPAVRDWLRALFHKVTADWGYDYVKIDFLYYPLESNTVAAGDLARVPGYRAALKAIREGCGPKTYILGCGAPIGPTIGLVDGNRVGPDVGTAWGGVVEAARNTAARQWMNGVWWQNDPDATVLRDPLTADQAHAWACAVALSGGLVMLSDDLDKLDTERTAFAGGALPVTAGKAQIADLWSGAEEPASAWVLPSSRSAANITVAGLFNWTGAPKTMAIDMKTLGVPSKSRRVHVWDIADANYLGAGCTAVDVPPTSCRLLALTPDAGHPQIIGTDVHLTGGAKDIAGVTWVARYKALRGQFRATTGRTFHIAVSQPDGTTFRAVEADGAAVERVPSAPGSVLLAVKPSKASVRLVLRFK